MFPEPDQSQPQQPAYKISTALYEGPLDLLLQLIENAELDITKLSLVQVTGPFLAYVQQLKDHKAEEVSSFLVVAARLMQIKSEALLPRPPEREPGEEDPGDELVQQLITYKKFKEIASILKQRDDDGLRTYLRLAPPPKLEGKLDMSDLTLEDLMAAAVRAMQLLEEKESVDTVVKPPKVTITDKITMITDKLRSDGSASFMTLLGENYSRVDVVVTFLALLELVKRFHIKAVQSNLFSDIIIEPTAEFHDDEDIEIEFIE